MRDASVNRTTTSVASASRAHVGVVDAEVEPVEKLRSGEEAGGDEHHRARDRGALEPARERRVDEQDRGDDDDARALHAGSLTCAPRVSDMGVPH